MRREETLLERLALAATCVQAGLSYGRALQWRGKRDLGPTALPHFQTRVLGPYGVGAGALEASALTLSAVATWRARGARRPRAVATAGVAGAFVVWAMDIRPVNRRPSVWEPGMTDGDAPAIGHACARAGIGCTPPDWRS